MKVYSGSKKKSLVEKKIELLTKCTDAITNSTLIESQGIKRSVLPTCVEEKLSALNKRQRTIVKRGSMMFCYSLKCLLEINLLIQIFNLSRMFNLSRFSTAIFKIPQSIKILTLWRTYLTVPQLVPQIQPTQWKTCQHEEIPTLTWIFLIAQSHVI